MKMIKLEKYKNKFEVAYNLLTAYLEDWKGEHNYFYYATKNEIQALRDVLDYFQTGKLELSPEDYNFIREIAKTKRLHYGKHEYTFSNPPGYEQDDSDNKVLQFLANHHIGISISEPVTVTKWNDTRNKYMVRFTRNGIKLIYAFFDSVHNYQQGIRPSVSSVIVPELYGDEPMDYQEFVSNFGYDEYDRETKKIYKAWMNLVTKAMNFFTESEREEMRGFEL